MSAAQAVTALEGWVSAGNDGGYSLAPGCCRSVGGAFFFALEERLPGSTWQQVTRTAEHEALPCGTVYVGPPYDDDYCCETPIPQPTLMDVEACVIMQPGREYRFVYAAPYRPFEYWHQVPPLTSSGGYPYRVVTVGPACPPPSGCSGTKSSGGSLAGCLSLHVDPDRDLQNLDADTTTYLPQGRLPDAAPTIIGLVATMPASRNVPPTSVIFTCQSSAWPGDAGNRARSTDPDFSITGTTSVPFQALPGTDLVFAETEVAVTDYGGEATFTATPASDPAAAVSLFVPVGAEVDHLPEAWTAERDAAVTVIVSATGLAPCADEDAQPVGTGVVGDGLATWEEYRGFFVKDRHVRTDPGVKDLFIDRVDNNQPPLPPGPPPRPWFDALSTLPTADHLVDNEDVEGDFLEYAVNPNHLGSDTLPCPGLVERRPLRVVVHWSLAPDLDTLAVTNFLAGHGCGSGPWAPLAETVTPGIVQEVAVYLRAIRRSTPPTASLDTADPSDDDALEYVTAHEIGHAINMAHFTPFPNLCPFVCGGIDTHGFPFPSADYFCQQAAQGLAPSESPYLWPETVHARRATPGPICGSALCLGNMGRPGCSVVPGSPVVHHPPTPACGPDSVMASLPWWWARPTCVTPATPSTLPAPWSDPCIAGAPYWTNIPKSYSTDDIVQIQVKP